MKIKKAVFWPILIVGVFVFLRLFAYRNLPSLPFYFGYDDAIYGILSQRFLAGDFSSGFHPYWNSGFPLMTLPFYLLTRSWEASQILVSITSHILLILVMYLTLRRISIPVALVASFFTAFSSSFTKLVASGGITEPFYILLFWLAIYFGWQAVTTARVNQYAFAGLFFGLAYLTRTEVIYTLAAFLMFAVLSFFLKAKSLPSFNRITILSLVGSIFAYLYIPITRLSKFSTFHFTIFKSTKGILFALPFVITTLISVFFERKKISIIIAGSRIAGLVTVLLTVFILVNLPYILTISKNLGHLTLSGKYAYIGSAHPFTPEKDRMTTWAQDVWSVDLPNFGSPYYDASKTLPTIWKWIEHALEATWKRMDTNLGFFAHDNVFTNFEATLILFGFVAAFLQKKFRNFIFYLLILWLVSFVFISHFMDAAARYLAFSFPIFYMAQAFAVVGFGNLLFRIRPVFLPLTIIIFTLWYFDKNFDTKSLTSYSAITKFPVNHDQKIIGDYLKSQGIDLIMARTEGIGFYANAKLVYMPAANPRTIIKMARAWGVEYLVARPNEASWNYMRVITNPNFKHPDLELKHKFEDGTLIWKVKLTEKERLYNFRTTEDVNEKIEDININSQIIEP